MPVAAIEMLPSGATMEVLTICAPPIRICCRPIGAPILNAVLTQSAVGRNRPGLRRSASWGERTSSDQAISDADTSMAQSVPSAAPGPPSPHTKMKM